MTTKSKRPPADRLDQLMTDAGPLLDQLSADMGPMLDDLLANSGHALDDLSAALGGDLDAMLNPVREENVTPMVTKTARI